MALNFLPPEQIRPAFEKLDNNAVPEIQAFMDYVFNTWIRSRVFTVSEWSVFGKAIRTNNDVEGWHNRLNSRCTTRGQVPFYLLIQELFKEASAIPLQVRLVSEGKLKRYQRRRTTDGQIKVFRLWKSYQRQEISTSRLLRECSFLL
ncbi:uncharacterized protein [Argopecten irradians]|uniref:uncharacterized protein n=1 Tax=Argopecten irradians TaxID=31199 RepID=UPI00371A9974